MTALATEDDPYLLPMPSPDSPVVLPKWISPGNTHPVSRCQDGVWSLAPLIDNPGKSLHKVNWKHCPESMRGEVKLVAWTMINGEHRPTYLRTRGMSARGRHAADARGNICRGWMRLARWLDSERGLGALAACREDEWRAYIAHRCEQGISRGRAEAILRNLTELWALISSPPAARGSLSRPG
ncbi:hypothetical protein ACWDA3_60280 [Nonomuraea rubra]